MTVNVTGGARNNHRRWSRRSRTDITGTPAFYSTQQQAASASIAAIKREAKKQGKLRSTRRRCAGMPELSLSFAKRELGKGGDAATKAAAPKKLKSEGRTKPEPEPVLPAKGGEAVPQPVNLHAARQALLASPDWAGLHPAKPPSEHKLYPTLSFRPTQLQCRRQRSPSPLLSYSEVPQSSAAFSCAPSVSTTFSYLRGSSAVHDGSTGLPRSWMGTGNVFQSAASQLSAIRPLSDQPALPLQSGYLRPPVGHPSTQQVTDQLQSYAPYQSRLLKRAPTVLPQPSFPSSSTRATAAASSAGDYTFFSSTLPDHIPLARALLPAAPRRPQGLAAGDERDMELDSGSDDTSAGDADKLAEEEMLDFPPFPEEQVGHPAASPSPSLRSLRLPPFQPAPRPVASLSPECAEDNLDEVPISFINSPYFAALSKSLPLPFPFPSSAPVTATWTGPCSATLAQRSHLSSSFAFHPPIEDETAGEDGGPILVGERMGLGCTRMSKAKVFELVQREHAMRVAGREQCSTEVEAAGEDCEEG